MAANNLRIIYNNLATGATITSTVAAQGTTSLANLLTDTKSLVYRAGAVTTVTITATLTGLNTISGIVIPFTNLTSTATMQVTLSNGSFTSFTGVASLACPYQGLGVSNFGTAPSGASGYAYGGGVYARQWLSTPIANVNRVAITIVDTNNTAGYLEFSRLIIGQYWSPTYNTEYGLSTSIKDLSTHDRTQAGDMISNRGVVFRSMSFNLNYMPPTDRVNWYTILKNGGLTNPMLISIFPDNSADWAKERDYMVYGKLTQFSDITHPIYNSYNTQVDIEEV